MIREVKMTKMEIAMILARQDLNRQKRITCNKRIWAKQAALGRKGKAHHAVA